MSEEAKPVYWLGTDEAGYGPNLGPLVVSATAWKIAAQTASQWDFTSMLGLVDADTFDWHRSLNNNSAVRTPIGLVKDSKKLYSAGKKLDDMQWVVDSFLSACGCVSERCRSYSQLLDVLTTASESTAYWFGKENERAFAQLNSRSGLASEAWSSSSVSPVGCTSAVINEVDFNQGLVECGNKATLLSRTTLNLVRGWLDQLPSDCNVIVDLDRHGGRKKYLPLLLEAMTADWMEVPVETADVSIYRWKTESRTVFFRFSIKGESRFPVAVASIVSKLVRERAMECFNRFWALQQPNLQPTAGYPVDAKRFRDATADARAKLKLDDQQFWRNA